MRRSLSAISSNGYFVAQALIPSAECSRLIDLLPSVDGAGSRELLAIAEFQDLVAEIRRATDISCMLGGLVAVQCILFKKTPSRNWSVRPHRDVFVPVNGTGDWGSAGRKDGMNTTRPSRSFLDRCLAVRIQLDGAPIEDVSVVAASHLDAEPRMWSDVTPVPVPRGGALVFRPTLVHASSKLSGTKSRRVLHYLFAPSKLPTGYSWYYAL